MPPESFVGTAALSRFSLHRLSTIEEFDEEEEVDAAVRKAGAEATEETQIAWIRSYDGTMVPVGLRQAFTETKECGYYDTGGGSVTRESPSLQVAQCRQLAHEGFDLFTSAASKDSSLNVDVDVPSAAADAEAGVNVYSTWSIAQTTAQPCYLEYVEELRPREHFEVPAVAESHDITSESSLTSIAMSSSSSTSSIVERCSKEYKDQETGGAEAMADIVRTTCGGMIAPLGDDMGGTYEDEGSRVVVSVSHL